MRSEIMSQEKNITTIKVTIDSQDFLKEINKTYVKLSKNASIPGFRKGHTPRKILELRFGKEAVVTEALEAMMPDIMEQLTDDYDLDLIEEPSVKVDVLEEGKDAELTIVFEVEPEVALADLSQITVTMPKYEVPESDVDGAIEEMRRRFSELNTVYRESREGDVVVADYTTVILNDDGSELMSHPSEEHSFELEPVGLKKEVFDGLLGASMGQERDAQVTIDQDYPDKKLAGKTARYHFSVKEIKERKLPDLDDKFARDFLGKEDGTVSSLREFARSMLESKAERDRRAIGERDMIDKAVEGSSMELPPTMIEKQKNYIMENAKKRGQTISDEEILKRAQDDVKEYFVLEAYGKDLDITLSKEDIDSELKNIALSNGVPVDSVRRAFFKNRDNMHGLANSLRAKKTVDAMMEKVQIQEKETDRPEGQESNSQE